MPVTVRIPDELKDRIDAARPATTSREAWVRDACRAILAMGGYPTDGSELEAGPAPVPRPADQDSRPGPPPPAPASSVVPSAPLRAHGQPPDPPEQMCATCVRHGPPRTRPCAKCGHKA